MNYFAIFLFRSCKPKISIPIIYFSYIFSAKMISSAWPHCYCPMQWHINELDELQCEWTNLIYLFIRALDLCSIIRFLFQIVHSQCHSRVCYYGMRTNQSNTLTLEKNRCIELLVCMYVCTGAEWVLNRFLVGIAATTEYDLIRINEWSRKMWALANIETKWVISCANEMQICHQTVLFWCYWLRWSENRIWIKCFLSIFSSSQFKEIPTYIMCRLPVQCFIFYLIFLWSVVGFVTFQFVSESNEATRDSKNRILISIVSFVCAEARSYTQSIQVYSIPDRK